MYDVQKVVSSNKFGFTKNTLELDLDSFKGYKSNFIKDIKVKIVGPNEHDFFVHQILDFIPISKKVYGELGKGLTNTFVGLYAMITASDTDGNDFVNFGNSSGTLSSRVIKNKPGTISEDDWLLWFDVITKEGTVNNVEAVRDIHRGVDSYLNFIREALFKCDPLESSETKMFKDPDNTKKRIVMVKQSGGSGVLHDTFMYPDEPSGAIGAYSTMEIKNNPIVLTPNEYRDGALHALT